MPGKSITGLSWFVVLVIARLPSGFWMSQAQTDPKRPAAAWLKLAAYLKLHLLGPCVFQIEDALEDR
jgi:hypothetical protein